MAGLLLLLCLFAPLQQAKSDLQRRGDDPPQLQALLDNLAQQVASSNAKIAAMEATYNAKLAAMETATHAKIAKLEVDLAKARTSIAFHAYLNKDNVTLGPSSPLILDTAITNVGNGYDVHTGNFRVPVSGNYVFVFDFMGDYHTATWLYLMVDDSAMDYSLSHGDGTTWDHASATFVAHLRAGQRVWLRSDPYVTKVYKGWYYTTFSGFLINADA